MVKLTKGQIALADSLARQDRFDELPNDTTPGKNGKQKPTGETGVPDGVKKSVRYDKHRNKDNGGDWKGKK